MPPPPLKAIEKAKSIQMQLHRGELSRFAQIGTFKLPRAMKSSHREQFVIVVQERMILPCCILTLPKSLISVE